jgi:general L-amino acid transport system permease protein
VWQVLALVLAGGLLALLVIQTAVNLRQRGIASGFAFLGRTAGFEIAALPFPYSSHDSYARALVVGLVNTLRVAALGIVLATALGLAIAAARLSSIWVLSSSARAAVELLRNTPLLLQLFFWYSLSQLLPWPGEALNPLPGVFLCIRGLFLPGLSWAGGGLLPALSVPAFKTYSFEGGLSIAPEFAALLIGLSTYTGAFIAEIVRGGVLAVDRGQLEAALALGLSRAKALRLVVLPQAMRVILPPATGQFVSLLKNSSLAVAIGYPDLVSVANTTLNQSGQAVEAIALVMVFYLAISLALARAMSVYARRGGWGGLQRRPS